MFCYYNCPYCTFYRSWYRPDVNYPLSVLDFIYHIIVPDLYEYYNSYLDEIKNQEPRQQLALIKERKAELERLMQGLYLNKLYAKTLIGVASHYAKSKAIDLSKAAFLIAGTTFSQESVSHLIEKRIKEYDNIKKDYDLRIAELEDELSNKIRVKEKARTPLTNKFISSLEGNLNSYKEYKSSYEQKQSQLKNLNTSLAQSKTDYEKEKLQAQIKSVEAQIANINSTIEGLKANVMTVFNEALAVYTDNSKSFAKVSPDYYPWIFDLNDKMIELEKKNYNLTKDDVQFIRLILNLAEEIASENQQISNAQNLFEQKQWVKANENLQPLFVIAKQ